MVKRLLTYSAVVLLFFCIGLSSCSKEEEGEPEKGKIEQMTDEAADAIVKRIRTPLDKARSAKDKGEERLKALDEELKDQ
ncbi:MAG: hypothetical protein V3V47_05790 [Desulfobacteria bacterium]